MKINEQVEQFIEENISLINESSKESWEEIYDKIDSPAHTGEFTEILLEAGIDPTHKLKYIPECFLFESDIKKYNISSNVDLICEYAFKQCDQLKEIFIPDNVLFIEEKAFLYCDSLRKVSLGGRLNGLDPFIFSGCESLYKLDYRGTKEEWREIAKSEYWAEDSSISKIICTDGIIEL